MWRALRKIVSRGRSAVPLTSRRIRFLRRARDSSFFIAKVLMTECSSLSRLDAGLAGLLADSLAGEPDALALVGLGRPEALDDGGRLPDQFLVDAVEDDSGLLLLDLRRDPVRQRILN